jgi:spore germination cell wall hydrolase CwlJ-like protein
MFDYLRLGGLAALALGAAGASGEVLVATQANVMAPAVVTEPLPPIPVTIPLPDDVRAQAAVVAELPSSDFRAQSLDALVRQHATSETADREQRCLATAIYFESKGEPLSGQLAVARVVINRADSGRFAPTLCGVVTQPGQFSFVRGGAMPAINPDSGSWRTAVAIAKIAQGDLWESKAENALYFHARRVSPGWRMARVGAIGNHVFYR